MREGVAVCRRKKTKREEEEEDMEKEEEGGGEGIGHFIPPRSIWSPLCSSPLGAVGEAQHGPEVVAKLNTDCWDSCSCSLSGLGQRIAREVSMTCRRC